jgi:hypothetical protein
MHRLLVSLASRRQPFTALLVVAISGSSASTGKAAPFWSGSAAGFRVVWDKDDLSAFDERSAKNVFSARGVTIALVGAKGGPCRFNETLRMKSLVGPYLGFEEASDTYCPGWAHPSGETRFRTIDLRLAHGASPQAVSLTDLFPAKAVSQSLLKDPVIIASDAGKLPSSLPDLLDQLATYATPPKAMCFTVPRDLLQRFVLGGISGEAAQVRLSLPGEGPCRMALTQLGLLLRPRPDLAAWLVAARDGTSGGVNMGHNMPHAATDMSFAFSALP